MRYLCECTSTSVMCSKTIELSDAVAKDIQAKRLVIIVQGCPRGPETTDELVETRAGYGLYRDKDFVLEASLRSIPSYSKMVWQEKKRQARTKAISPPPDKAGIETQKTMERPDESETG